MITYFWSLLVGVNTSLFQVIFFSILLHLLLRQQLRPFSISRVGWPTRCRANSCKKILLEAIKENFGRMGLKFHYQFRIFVYLFSLFPIHLKKQFDKSKYRPTITLIFPTICCFVSSRFPPCYTNEGNLSFVRKIEPLQEDCTFGAGRWIPIPIVLEVIDSGTNCDHTNSHEDSANRTEKRNA